MSRIVSLQEQNGSRSRFTLAWTSLITAAALSVGCYGAAPGVPSRIVLPDPLPTRISVDSESKTSLQDVQKKSVTCPQGHVEGSPACIITKYSVKEPVTTTTTRAKGDTQQLNLAQFKVLTDPEWDRKQEALQALSSSCSIANVPRWIGIGLTVVGLVGVGVAAAMKEPAVTAVGGIGVGAGVTSYALGYFLFGGNKCSEATALYNQLEISSQTQIMEARGEDTAREMKSLADHFNSTRR